MIKYLNDVPNDFRDQLNEGLMRKSFDKLLEELIFYAFKGFEILPNIKIIGYEWVPDEDKFDANNHVIRRNKNKNKAVKNISETRCGVMYLDVEINGITENGKEETRYIKKPIILPIVDDKGYLKIRGKSCYLIYQLVDKVLYPSFGAVTVKSLMPICVKTNKMDFTDTEGYVHTIPIYNIQIFKNSINVLLIYSNLGIDKTLNFLEVDRFIRIHDKNSKIPNSDKVINFECGKKSNIIVSVIRDVFEKEIYVKSIVGCLIELFSTNKVKYEDINNWEYWMMLVGGKNTVRRGVYQHIFFNRLLDDVTRKELKINEYDKQNIYYLLRWIIGNYHVLWKKDNLSMVNKRLRCNEYIASLITVEISRRLNRIISLGDRAKISDYIKAFKFPKYSLGLNL